MWLSAGCPRGEVKSYVRLAAARTHHCGYRTEADEDKGVENVAEVKVALKNVMVAVDFSFPPETLLAYASSIARRYEGKLFLAHVVPPDYYQLNPVKDVAAYKFGRKLDALGKAADLGDLKYEVLVGTGDDVSCPTSWNW